MKNFVTRSSRRLRRLSIASAAVAVQLIAGATVVGASYTFNGGSAIFPPNVYFPNWAYPLNWDGGSVPASSNSSDVAFSGSFGGPLLAIQDIADPFNLHSLTFNTPYTITGGALRWDVAGSIQNSSGATVLNPLVLNQVVTYDGAGSALFAGAISGAGTLRKNGSGNLTLGGAASNFGSLQIFDGSVTVNGGSLVLNSTALPLYIGSNKTMTVAGGAALDTRTGPTSFYDSSVGSGPTMTLTGAGTTWRAGQILVGNSGNYATHLIVEAGASIMQASLLSIGDNYDTEYSTLLVQSGGTVTAERGGIGTYNGLSRGSVTVTGAGSKWSISNSLELGSDLLYPNAGIGQLTISDSGMVVNSGATTLSSTSSMIRVDGGVFSTGFLLGTAGSIEVNNSAADFGHLVIGSPLNNGGSFYGSVTGSGNVTKVGRSVQTLGGSNSYSGFTAVYDGTLRLNSGASFSYSADSGGTLILGFGNLGTSTVLSNIGGTVRYYNGAFTGGFLEGGGTHDIQNVATFNWTTIGSNVHFNVTTPMQLTNVTNNGLMSNSAGNILNWNHGVNGQFARLDTGYATTNVSDVVNNGAIRVFAGTLNNSSTPLVTTAGSSITITSDVGGSTLNLGGQTLEVNGGLVINDGTINGTTNVNSGGRLRGTGVFGPINVLAGGNVSPGNSPGKMTSASANWGSGGTYLFEINDASGIAGINWDLWNVNGSLNVTAGTTTNSRFTLSIASLDSVNAPANAAHFNSHANYSWLIASATGGTGGYDAGKFTIDSSQFTNPTTGGTFSLAQSANNLFLNFTPAIQPQWSLNGTGSWNVALHWNPAIVPNTAQMSANFLGVIQAPSSALLVIDQTVGAISFDNPNSYTLDGSLGGTLTIAGGFDPSGNDISVANGNHFITAPLVIAASTNAMISSTGSLNVSGGISIAAGQTLSRSKAGTMTISGPQRHGLGSSFTAAGGLTNINSNAGVPATKGNRVLANLSVNINDQGHISLGADQDLRNLQITTEDDGPQQLDLNSPHSRGDFRSVRVYADDMDGAKESLYRAITNANGANARDHPDGIYDSGQSFHANSRIGLAIVEDLNGDRPLLIRLTRIGDLNLDGVVTISDFIDLASHFNGPGTWQEGDLNYDGQVTISDFIDLASNFNSSFSGDVLPISLQDQKTLADFAQANGGASVPEPAMGCFFLLATALITRRGRNRKQSVGGDNLASFRFQLRAA